MLFSGYVILVYKMRKFRRLVHNYVIILKVTELYT